MFESIRELLISGYDVDPALITPGAALGEDLGLDSIDVVDFIMDLEDAYSIQISDEVFDRAKNLGELALLLEEVRGAAGESGAGETPEGEPHPRTQEGARKPDFPSGSKKKKAKRCG